MTCRARFQRGFTLIEVMAAVLVLGLLYTVLAGAAMRGLRSEGTDHRRADAELMVDLELASVEFQLAAGELKDGRTERDEDPYRVRTEILPIDALSLLPPKLGEEIARTTDPRAPSLLHDERGQSRVRRVSVIVEWDEAGQPEQVERSTFTYDKSALAQLFPSGAEGGAAGNTPSPEENSLDALRKSAPPELQGLIPNESKSPGSKSSIGSPKATGPKSAPRRRNR